MAAREVEAIFDDEEVLVPSKEDADMLLQSGYGTLSGDKSLILSRCEALYLVNENRAKVVEGTDKAEVSFQILLERFRLEDPQIWIRYLIFRDLRSRGYVVKDGVGWGIDFRMYERGKYGAKAAKYVVFTICEGDPTPISRLKDVLRLTHGMKKELIVAVLDRRGEIVYYSLSRLKPEVEER